MWSTNAAMPHISESRLWQKASTLRQRAEKNLIVRTAKSEAEVTNSKRLHSRYCTGKASYWQTRSIAQPLGDSSASCSVGTHECFTVIIVQTITGKILFTVTCVVTLSMFVTLYASSTLAVLRINSHSYRRTTCGRHHKWLLLLL